MKFVLILFLVAVFSGCSGSLKAVIFDTNGLKKEVLNLTTDKGNFLEVFDGLAFRNIKLSKISVIKISPSKTKSHKGELYYLTEIWLIDGSKIQSYILSSGASSGAFVNVNSTIRAKTVNGKYEIKIKDVRKIKFLRL